MPVDAQPAVDYTEIHLWDAVGCLRSSHQLATSESQTVRTDQITESIARAIQPLRLAHEHASGTESPPDAQLRSARLHPARSHHAAPCHQAFCRRQRRICERRSRSIRYCVCLYWLLDHPPFL